MIRCVEYLFFISFLATIASLVLGLTVYFKGGIWNERYGNTAMRWRVTFQALTIILFVFLLWLKAQS